MPVLPVQLCRRHTFSFSPKSAVYCNLTFGVTNSVTVSMVKTATKK
jgi:hypothetical protein